MAIFQELLIFYILLVSFLFLNISQEGAQKNKEKFYKISEIFKTKLQDTISHSLCANNKMQTELVNVINIKQIKEDPVKLGRCNESSEDQLKTKKIICMNTKFYQQKGNLANSSSNTVNSKRTRISTKLDFNETLKFLRIKKTSCYSPLPSVSPLLDTFHNRNSLRSNIAYEFNFHNSKHAWMMFTILVIIFVGKQLKFELEPSDYENISATERTKSQLLMESLARYADILSVLKLSNMDKKETFSIDKKSSYSTEKMVVDLCPQTDFRKTINLSVYPVFNMTRLASYRPISSVESPNSFFQLSEAGFHYLGQENIIVCEGCNKCNNLMTVVTSPSNAIYHNHGCQYIIYEAPSENILDGINSSLRDPNFAVSSNLRENISSSEISMTQDLSISEIMLEGLPDFGLTADTLNDTRLFKYQSSRTDNCITAENNRYLRLEGLEMHKLESQYQNEFFVRLTRRCAQLTAKIECKDKNMFGSGYVIHFPCKIISTKSILQMPSWNEDLKRMFQNNAQLGIIYIQTTSHLFPEKERPIKNREVSLCLDNRIYKKLKLNGHYVVFNTKKGISQAILVCFTADLNLIKYINELQKELLNDANMVPVECKESLSKSVFIISHPHGNEKMLSFGKFSLGKYIILNKEEGEFLSEYDQCAAASSSSGSIRKALLYDALTWDGSSGAPVVTFKKTLESSDWIVDIWTHNAINIADTKGVSVLREHIDEENISVAISEINHNERQLNFEASRVTQLRTTSQVPPSYPVYITTLKRSESFLGWKFAHIMNTNILVEAGFFYAGYGDCVRCFQCGLGLRSWKSGDDVYTEHERFRPTCPLLQSQLSRSNISSPQSVFGNTNQVHLQMGKSTFSNSVPSQDSPKLQMLLNLAASHTLVTDSSQQQASALENGMSSELPQNATIDRNASSSASLTGLADVENLSNASLENAGIEQSSTTQKTNEFIDAQASPLMSQKLSETVINTNRGAKNVAAKLLERENKLLQGLLKCKLCKEAPIKDLFLPCGDLYACSECSQKLSHCPACGKRILGTVTTHF